MRRGLIGYGRAGGFGIPNADVSLPDNESRRDPDAPVPDSSKCDRGFSKVPILLAPSSMTKSGEF